MGLIEEILANVDERLELAKEIKHHHPGRSLALVQTARQDMDFVRMIHSLQRHTAAVQRDYDKVMTRAQQQRFR
jgi:hypothetical protein